MDKCICIKTFYNPNNTTAFIQNKTYEYTEQQFVTRELPKGFNVQFSKGEYLYFREEQGLGCFHNFFKTLKQLRKEKLIKING